MDIEALFEDKWTSCRDKFHKTHKSQAEAAEHYRAICKLLSDHGASVQNGAFEFNGKKYYMSLSGVEFLVRDGFHVISCTSDPKKFVTHLLEEMWK